MKVWSVFDDEFRKYGRIVTNVDFAPLLQVLRETDLPDGVVYEPSVPALEDTPVTKALSEITYGEMPIQIGYCNGHNGKLNALEYHRDSEINVCGTDAILMLGLMADVKPDFTYDTSNVKAFYVPAGTAVEVFATTLHYAPCGVEGAGFKVGIVLPKGTNYPLKNLHESVNSDGTVPSEDALLTAVNKWLIGHVEGGLEAGTFIGLRGDNCTL